MYRRRGKFEYFGIYNRENGDELTLCTRETKYGEEGGKFVEKNTGGVMKGFGMALGRI